MSVEATARCEHLACVCEVPIGRETCSDYCASPAGRDAQNVRCECGHDVCAKAIEEQLHGAGGRESA